MLYGLYANGKNPQNLILFYSDLLEKTCHKLAKFWNVVPEVSNSFQNVLDSDSIYNIYHLVSNLKFTDNMLL